MSTELVELPQGVGTPTDVVPSSVPADVRIANTATHASAITAVSGLSGGGKSSLADTAAEYAHEVHHKVTLCYAIDPGGFGTKRVALIRAGIMRVWDPRNHVNYFETMELATMGAWPETIEDPERGYADPNVALILPRRMLADLYCPQGHLAKRFDNTATYTAEVAMNLASNAGGVSCQTCGIVTNLGNAGKVDRLIVRHRMFRDVGLRIYDSITAMNDAGLIIELPTMSANNKFAKGKEGGSALGSADAFKQGVVTYGTGSEAQVGFMQNRTYGWLMNIRQLPDVVVPTICTFGIEESKKDDESGGLQILGPRIAGKARTSAVPGWVGNLVYASHEPEDLPRGTATSANMVFRLWLTTHTDPRDSRRMPILAKHRGTPLGIDFLEDPWDVDPMKRKANAWKRCSLGTLFRMLDAQVLEEEAALRAKYPQAPGFVAQKEETGSVDEIIGTYGAKSVVMAPVTTVSAGTAPGVVGAPVVAQAPMQAPGMPRVARRRATVAAPLTSASVATVPVTPGATVPPVLGAADAGVVVPTTTVPPVAVPPAVASVASQPEAPSVVAQQLQASIVAIEAAASAAADQRDAIEAEKGAPSGVLSAVSTEPPTPSGAPVEKAAAPTTTTPAQPASQSASAPAPSPVSTPTASGTSAAAAPTPAPVAPTAPTAPTTATPPAAAQTMAGARVVRRPRPPV